MTKEKIQYFRPNSLEEALALKKQYGKEAQFLSGGVFKPQLKDETAVLIDLQDAKLDSAEATEESTKYGALVPLQMVDECLDLPDFSEALSTEFGVNVRNSLSLGNFLGQANGRSTTLCCLNALGTKVISMNHPAPWPLVDFLRANTIDDLVIEVQIPTAKGLAFETVGRSPKDLPIVCVAAVKNPDGTINVAFGGAYDIFDSIALSRLMDDGQEAIKTAFANSDDKWASAEYRQSAASILLARALQKLERAGHDQEEK